MPMMVDKVGDSQKRHKQAKSKNNHVPMIVDKEEDSQKRQTSDNEDGPNKKRGKTKKQQKTLGAPINAKQTTYQEGGASSSSMSPPKSKFVTKIHPNKNMFKKCKNQQSVIIQLKILKKMQVIGNVKILLILSTNFKFITVLGLQ